MLRGQRQVTTDAQHDHLSRELCEDEESRDEVEELVALRGREGACPEPDRDAETDEDGVARDDVDCLDE